MVREIELHGKFSQQYPVALVDDEDYDLIVQSRRFAYPAHTVYARKNRPYIQMQTLLMPPHPGFEVDHADGNGLNNQRSNLSVVTYMENHWNKNNHKKKSSKFPGVDWRSQRGKWRARIRHPLTSRDHNLGHFFDEIEAAVAYMKAVSEFYNEELALKYWKMFLTEEK